MIKAKPIISNKFWILRDNNKKVGEINVDNNGYRVNLKGKNDFFNSLVSLKNATDIDFYEDIERSSSKATDVHGYPASGEIFNPVWNTELRLPLYNKKEVSKSWFAAGYYQVRIKDVWRILFSPKLILLERNEYHGPYYNSAFNDLH